jgi:hypothetical protein
MATGRSVRLITEAHSKQHWAIAPTPRATTPCLAERAGTHGRHGAFRRRRRGGSWSRAVLRQADHAIFVAQAHRPAPPSELETLALDLIPQTQRRLVLIHPHRMQRATGTAHWLTSRPVFLHHHVALTEDGEDIARLARFLTGRAIGMVLSGGGAFGVAHVGVWRAIRDLGIPVDIVGGTSVGAAMAGAIALGVPAKTSGPGSRISSSAPARCGA